MTRPSGIARLLILFTILVLAAGALAAPRDIDTFAGGPGAGAALELALTPRGIIQRGSSLYIVDQAFSVVRRIDMQTGNSVVVAGNGTAGFSGDGGPATEAQLQGPAGITLVADGAIIIADTGNHRLRFVDLSTGLISTIAGTGEAGFSGDGGPATAAKLNTPSAVLRDPGGRLFIADTGNNRIREIVGTNIRTVIGGGTEGLGDGLPLTRAQLSSPGGLAVDLEGRLLIADAGHHRVRRARLTDNVITTVAGNGQEGLSDGGLATSSAFSSPWGVAVDSSGAILIADSGNSRIRRVHPTTGIVTFVVGAWPGGFGGDGGPPTSALIAGPMAIALDDQGRLLIADTGNHRVRRVDFTNDKIISVAGNGTAGLSGDGGPALLAQLAAPAGMRIDAHGNVVFADTGNNRVRRIDAQTGAITTLAELPGATDVAIHPGGDVFVAQESASLVSRIDALTGNVAVVAGDGTFGIGEDGVPATSTPLWAPRGVEIDAAGNVFIADTGSARIRHVDATTGRISTFSGGFLAPAGVAIDHAGNVYVADGWAFRVVRVDPVTRYRDVVAGTGTQGSSGDGGPATSAELSGASRIALDSDENLLIADVGNDRVRRVDALTGIITTVAGNGVRGFSGDGGPATAAQIAAPSAVTVDPHGDVYIGDTINHRIRRVDNSCDPESDDAQCTDGVFCNGVERCVAGSCVPATEHACPIACNEQAATCEQSCGDGVVQPGEQCDDGNLTDGDCCSSACTIEPSTTVCRPSAGACDVAESCDGVSPTCPTNVLAPEAHVCRPAETSCDVSEECSGASADCPVDEMSPDSDDDGLCDAEDSCTGGFPLSKARLRLAGFNTGTGDDQLRFSGRLSVPPDTLIDPRATGLRLLIEAGGAVLLDVTAPPGLYTPSTRAGWSSRATGNGFVFASATPLGGAVDRITLARRSSSPEDVIRVVVRGEHGSFAMTPPALPLRITVVLGATSEAGECTQLEFAGPRPSPSCRAPRSHDKVVCR